MSKLPNAPLKEVSAQLTWHLGQNDFGKYGFLSGDYYAFIKENYPTRETIIPDGVPFQFVIDNPTHKFRQSDGKFPFIVIGPGILGINVDDDNYYWNDFHVDIKNAIEPIFDLIPKLSKFDHIHLSLEYIDFYEIDFDKQTIFEFINENLNFKIEQNFLKTLKNKSIDLNFNYEDENVGSLKFSYTKGKIKGHKSGLIVRTSAVSGIFPSNLEESNLWFDKAHKRCSEVFKNMTKGKLYESFC